MVSEEASVEQLQERVKHLEEENRKWMRLAGTSRVTELPNSLMLFQVVLPRELRQDSQEPIAFSTVLVCPDALGEVNQEHGRVIGDELLRQVARHFKENLEEHEQLFHCDGANFALVIPHTPEGRARRRATVIKNQFKQHTFKVGGIEFRKMTCSAGTSEVAGGVPPAAIAERLEELYGELCNRLYEAKKLGGDAVVGSPKI